MTRARLSILFCAAAMGAAACNVVLGLDAPTLAEGGSAADDGGSPVLDGGADAPVPEGSTGRPDTGSGAGVRCGSGASATFCSGATPHCCQTGSADAPVFSCVVDAGACSGYDITCADYNDCSGTEICCHFMAHQVCDVASKCPNNEIVCDDAADASCPTGWTCSVPFVGDAAASSAYLGCAP